MSQRHTGTGSKLLRRIINHTGTASYRILVGRTSHEGTIFRKVKRNESTVSRDRNDSTIGTRVHNRVIDDSQPTCEPLDLY